jgi:hypothetical protein
MFQTACERKVFEKQTVVPKSLRDVSALRLNFRYEPDVPAPPVSEDANQTEQLNQLVVSQFNSDRPDEAIDKTILSPDKQRFLVVYHKPNDGVAEFRLDMYSADGQLLRKITPDSMAANFPDTIRWAPDSGSVAFVATTRLSTPAAPVPDVGPAPDINDDANSNTADANANSNANTNSSALIPIETPKLILTFRTEQIYVCDREGLDLKPLTQEEGKIHFYFAWSPDSTSLAALATTWREWQANAARADTSGELLVPEGRPRLIERSGRIRRLDDNVTKVYPAWSPDSAKVAFAFDKEVRIYDAIGDTPTQAALPLRNSLLLSSSVYDEQKRREISGAENSDAHTGKPDVSNISQATAAGALPDENALVSFNPIVRLEWTDPEMLYFETAYLRFFKDEAKNVKSFARWHRVIFSAQPVQIN